jgi:hypothetical protein
MAWPEDTSGLSYIVVDEIEEGIVGLAVSEWPRKDEKGRLRFESDPVLLGAEREAFERFLDRYREPRPLRIGDVFAARTRPVAEAEPRLEPVLAPEQWIEPPVHDVTADAREAAKVSFYSAVAPVLEPD